MSNSNEFKEPIGRKMSRKQSDAEPPQVKMVSVAVLPPRLPSQIAPPTGIGASDCISWDESLNWQHNDPIGFPQVSSTKKFFRKAGLTTQRQRKNPDLPPFTFRQVPYDTWRKHYAKDADGNYQGTHAPAQDCLLKPEDVKKWRFDDPTTNADKWTRGSEALPVYSEVLEHGRVPEYAYEYEHGIPPTGEPSVDRTASTASDTVPPERPATEGPSKVIADGKTAQQIIDDYKKKSKPKMTWKQKLQHGAEIASMGS